MLTSYFKNKKWTLWAYGGLFLIIILLISQTYLDVLFNAWYKDFYDLLFLYSLALILPYDFQLYFEKYNFQK